MSQSPAITIITKAVRKAAKGLQRDFSELDRLQVSKKGVQNFVTSADLRTERILREELELARPGYSFLLEEGGEIEGKRSDHRWVIDPIDGTTNFIHAVPYFCISVAMEKKQHDGQFEVVTGVVYDPIHDELFAAEKGKGAFLNDIRIQVSQRTEDFFLSSAPPRTARPNYDAVKSAFERVTESGAIVRCSGAAALDLAYVAAGRLDGTWYHTLQPWDIAAGVLMVKEAGGLATELNGAACISQSTSVVAGNKLIQDKLQKLVADR